MAKKEQISYETILHQITKKEFKPVYLLMGEESYFIDRITEAILENALTESERDFNEIVLYGADTEVYTIINEARFYPSFANNRVVIVKEAQEIKKLEELISYVQKPLSSTILVINYKNGTTDGRKKWVTEIEKQGIVFESKKLYDSQIPSWINGYVSKKGWKIDPKSSIMLADFIGSDLNRIVSELDKLIITMPAGQSIITPEQIERNIGISKEYNNFEFLKAVIQKDVLKSNRIAQYFDKNPKANPMNLTLIVLHNFFSNLMLCHYLPTKTEVSVTQGLKIPPFQSKDYLVALKNFSPMKTMQIISMIRQTDAKSKGVGSTGSINGEHLRELLFRILHN